MHGSRSIARNRARLMGFVTETRFFALANEPCRNKPNGFLCAVQADPLLDARGIDGFLYFGDPNNQLGRRRIPIQIKIGLGNDLEFIRIVGKTNVPLIRSHPGASQKFTLEQIRKLSSIESVMQAQYDSLVEHLVRYDATPNELALIGLIERSRTDAEEYLGRRGITNKPQPLS